MPVRLSLLTLSTLFLVVLLWALPSPSPAQGQYETWDLVVQDDDGWLISLNEVGTRKGITTYKGELAYIFRDNTYGGTASAAWQPSTKVLIITAHDNYPPSPDTISYSFNLTGGTTILSGFYFYVENPRQLNTIGGKVIKGPIL